MVTTLSTTTLSISARIDVRIAERHLLKHPFYQAWTAGTLPRESLVDYAGQYYAFESRLPGFLKALAARADSPAARDALLANARDEEHGDGNHPELWLRFGEALGLERTRTIGTRLNPTTQALIDTYREACENAPVVAGVAALYAYESQLPAVAEAKIAGLRAHFGFGRRFGRRFGKRFGERGGEGLGDAESRRGLAFFEVHRTLDVHHAAEERTILEAAGEGESAETAARWADRALEAWWSFLSGVYPAGDTCAAGDGTTLTSRIDSLN